MRVGFIAGQSDIRNALSSSIFLHSSRLVLETCLPWSLTKLTKAPSVSFVSLWGWGISGDEGAHWNALGLIA